MLPPFSHTTGHTVPYPAVHVSLNVIAPCPDMDCEMIFDPAERQPVWSVTRRGEPVPSKPPPLSVMVRLIASLGGSIDRPNRLDPPGVETVWKGVQRMRDLAWGWETFRPKALSVKKDVVVQ